MLRNPRLDSFLYLVYFKVLWLVTLMHSSKMVSIVGYMGAISQLFGRGGSGRFVSIIQRHIEKGVLGKLSIPCEAAGWSIYPLPARFSYDVHHH